MHHLHQAVHSGVHEGEHALLIALRLPLARILAASRVTPAHEKLKQKEHFAFRKPLSVCQAKRICSFRMGV